MKAVSLIAFATTGSSMIVCKLTKFKTQSFITIIDT